MIAAGAVLLPGTQVPGGQLWSGNPAIFMRNLTQADIAALDKVCRVGNVTQYLLNSLIEYSSQ
jgi:carbonic anhydrase/acetyltransferase-like protein (isoleucine patch superfamily)